VFFYILSVSNQRYWFHQKRDIGFIKIGINQLILEGRIVTKILSLQKSQDLFEGKPEKFKKQ